MAIDDDDMRFQLAGMANPDSGQMARRVQAQDLYIPTKIRIDGDLLTWSAESSQKKARYKQLSASTHRILDDFIRLVDASPECILKFAGRYGVFGMIKVPTNFPPLPNQINYKRERWRIQTWRDDPEAYDGSGERFVISELLERRSEPLDLWRFLSRRVHAYLKIAVSLYQNPPGSGDDESWRVLGFGSAGNVEEAQAMLWFGVNNWIEIGNVRLRIFPEKFREAGNPAWNVNLSYGDHKYTLFGALATQLMLAVARQDRLYVCRGCCGAFWQKKRRQTVYCDSCGKSGKGKPQKDADRRRKDKMIEARRLAGEGHSYKEIASVLNIRASKLNGHQPEKTVRKWISKGRTRNGKAKTR